MVPWVVSVTTSDILGAGTDSDVYLVAYGNQDKSDAIILDNESDNFERGQCDQFKVETCDIGKPFKIRIGHNNSHLHAAWHLEKVIFPYQEIQRENY